MTQPTPHPDSLTRDQLREVLTECFNHLRANGVDADFCAADHLTKEQRSHKEETVKAWDEETAQFMLNTLFPIVATIEKSTAMEFVCTLALYSIHCRKWKYDSNWIESNTELEKKRTEGRTALTYADYFILHFHNVNEDPIRGQLWEYEIHFNRHQEKSHDEHFTFSNIAFPIKTARFGIPKTLTADITFHRDMHPLGFNMLHHQLKEWFIDSSNEKDTRPDPRSCNKYLAKRLNLLLYYLSDDHGNPKTFVLEGKKANKYNYAAFICRLLKLPDDMIKSIVKYYKKPER